KRLLELLTTVERGLSMWCLEQMNMELSVIERLLDRRRARKENQARISSEELDRDVGERYRQSLWGDHWLGKERQFYVAAMDAVNSLSWSDVLAICGVDVGLATSLLQQAHEQLLHRQLPDRLRFNTTMSPHGEILVRLTGYSDNDQLVVPHKLAE